MSVLLMRILIVKLGSIGDIVHTLPALAAIRKALPDAEISWVVERRAAEILRDNPILDRLIEVDTKALRRGLVSGETLRAPRQQLRQLRASAFDLALDFQGLLKSASIARLSGARRVFGFSSDFLREPASRIFHSKSISISENLHVIRKNLALAEGALGISIPTDADDMEFPIATTSAHEAEAREAALPSGGGYAILNPGGGWPTKLWDAGRFGRLADELWSQHGLHSLVTYGPGRGRVGRDGRAGEQFRQSSRCQSFVERVLRTRQTRAGLRRRRYRPNTFGCRCRHSCCWSVWPHGMVAKWQPTRGRYLRRAR